MKIRTDWNDPLPVTDLSWNPRVYSRVRKPHHRGALVGTLWGVPVDGHACGRAAVYQFQALTGEVRTVWWDGTMCEGSPYLYDVDTDQLVLRNPAAISWFCRLGDVPVGVVRNPDMP